jgi:HEAT repeat protein
MEDSTGSPPTDRVVDLLERGAVEEAAARLGRVQTTSLDERRAAVRALKAVADDRPTVVAPVSRALGPFLEDGDRSIRLTTAKLLVALAEADADAVAPVVSTLADRLADEEEFYYVRARAAEALGYVALDRPDAAGSPEIGAELRVGLSFDEPEVKEKLAKALEYVGLGDPSRLRHHVSTLSEHVDDDDGLVRYHLVTALVAVGCEYPDRLSAASDALRRRLDDENARVRGRAAEALGLLARAESDGVAPSAPTLRELARGDEPFVVERARFALSSLGRIEDPSDLSEAVGSRESVRRTTGEAADAVDSPDADGTCPHCGLTLPESAPPLCPRCGGPY